MEIYVVQPGDSIEIIARKYNISVARLIEDNGLDNPTALVVGQAILILHPVQIYTVKEGDSLYNIAEAHHIPLLQLLRNNPSLSNRNYIYPGENLVIQYNSSGEILTNGYAYSFINHDILKKTLPYLSFLSIFNYRVTEDGTVTNYGEDRELIKLANDYHTVPLLMVSALSPLGELHPELVYEILLNEEKGNTFVENILSIVQQKGFGGVNTLISYINTTNQNLYIKLLTKLSTALKNEGYLFIVTINPNVRFENNSIQFEKLDYESISQLVYQLIFIQYAWSANTQPPSPVSSLHLLRTFLDYIKDSLSNPNSSLGKPLIGYDWTLPYIPGKSSAHSMTLDSALTLAHDYSSVIQFDEYSHTPYFHYTTTNIGMPVDHIVWFIDSRSIKSLDDLIVEYGLDGSGIWNINNYDQQLWSIINARFHITRLVPEF